MLVIKEHCSNNSCVIPQERRGELCITVEKRKPLCMLKGEEALPVFKNFVF